MEEPRLIRLNLRAPLCYREEPVEPFAGPLPAGDETGELLFSFELDPEQANRIDPEPASFPGRLVAAGRRDGGQGERASAGLLQLPEGLYAFVQKRAELGREECAALAVEQQKDALWERLKLNHRLYIRLLFEDGSPVTQLFRPCLDDCMTASA